MSQAPTASAPAPTPTTTSQTTRLGDIARTWWPLAVSWLFMGLEIPMVSAVVARLSDPNPNLAAFGGLVFPLALLIEAPIIMMLSASTALSRDWIAFKRLRRFMHQLSAALTLLHALIAFTPLFDWIAVRVLHMPQEIIEPGRLGMQLLVPWTWAIADRRFHQGLLIRFGQTSSVGIGTVVRLCATGSCLAVGFLLGTVPGCAVAAAAISFGVLTEAAYARLASRPLRNRLRQESTGETSALPFRGMLAFYIPLALTPLIGLIAQPLGAAAMGRMPHALTSLAAWPALNGLIFLTRSSGFALNEVVVSYWDRPGASKQLWRFAMLLSTGTLLILLLIILTPLAQFWFGTVSGLDPELTALATSALWFALVLTPLSTFQNMLQGILVNAKRTRAIPESMAMFLMSALGILAIGIWVGRYPGAYVTLVAFAIGGLAQVGWLLFRGWTEIVSQRG